MWVIYGWLELPKMGWFDGEFGEKGVNYGVLIRAWVGDMLVSKFWRRIV